jgi:XTP/dITP diphosphohydrolase
LKNNNELLIASSNQGKVKEFKKLFQTHKVFSLIDLSIEDAIEDGSSFIENALIKAKHGCFHSNKFTIADDSGLVVPELGFEPGIYSARYAGKEASDEENRNHLMNKLNQINKEELDAYYVCVLVGLRSHNDPMPIITHGEIHGKISIKFSIHLDTIAQWLQLILRQKIRLVIERLRPKNLLIFIITNYFFL